MKYTALFLIVILLNMAAVNAQHDTPRQPFFKPSTALAEATPAFKVDTISDLQEVANILLGPGINLLNISFTGDPFSLATFVDTTGTFGIDSGLVISTGSVNNISGPNVSGGTSTAFGLPGDTSLGSLIPGYTTWDAVILEMDFIPLTDTLIATEMIFGSEEYPEYVFSPFNDVFGFFLSNASMPATNVALIPGTQTAVSINNVNATLNSSYYHDNSGGSLVEFDGYTTPMPLFFPVSLGSIYHLKIAIADAGDQVFDSGIFLKKHSLTGFAMQPVAGFTPSLSGLDLTLTNTSQYARYFEWDLGDGTSLADSSYLPVQHSFAAPGQYTIRLIAHNFYKSDTISQSVSVLATGSDEGTLSHSAVLETLGNNRWEVRYTDISTAWVSVTDMNGRELYRVEKPHGSERCEISTGRLVPGMYLIRSIQGDKVAIFKIMLR